MNVLKMMGIALACTIIIELFFAFILGVRRTKDFLNIVLVNVLTNPILVSTTLYINVFYGLETRKIVEVILEILVVFVEGTIYQKYLNYNKINGYIVALILNICSYGLGFIINSIIY